MTAPVTHPRFAPRRGAVRIVSWWGRAWQRAVEESAYGEAELRAARRLARAGAVGSLSVRAGEVVAAVDEGDDTWTVRVEVPVLEPEDRGALADRIAAETGRIADLLAGELPLALVEDLEESGVELLPFGGQLDATCSCAAWMQPCAHALAVMHQLGWLLDADPFVLLAVRGVSRDWLLGEVHARAATLGSDADESADDGLSTDLDVALAAMREAAALLE